LAWHYIILCYIALVHYRTTNEVAQLSCLFIWSLQCPCWVIYSWNCLWQLSCTALGLCWCATYSIWLLLTAYTALSNLPIILMSLIGRRMFKVSRYVRGFIPYCISKIFWIFIKPLNTNPKIILLGSYLLFLF